MVRYTYSTIQARYGGGTNEGTFLKSDGKCTETAITRVISIVIGQTNVEGSPPTIDTEV